MIPVHPALASLPAALLVALCVVAFWECFVGYRWLAVLRRFFMVAIVLVGMATFFSGYHASWYADAAFTVDDAVIAIHHRVGRTFVLLLVPLGGVWILRELAEKEDGSVTTSRVARVLFLLLSLATAITASYASYLGGELVFAHGAGVRRELSSP